MLEPQPSQQVAAVGRVLDLYIDMHDAKFDGGRKVAGARALERLFETPELFAQVCPEGTEDEAGQHVPWRGLREILRFGGLSPLMPVFERHPVRAADVDVVEKEEAGGDGESDSPIAAAQKRREELHEKWTKKKKFSKRDREAYCKALDEVSRHRLLAAHVRLRNHARLHRLLMQVLGRLIDYAGLWERDLYFATLALLARRDATPRQTRRPRREILATRPDCGGVAVSESMVGGIESCPDTETPVRRTFSRRMGWVGGNSQRAGAFQHAAFGRRREPDRRRERHAPVDGV